MPILDPRSKLMDPPATSCIGQTGQATSFPEYTAVVSLTTVNTPWKLLRIIKFKPKLFEIASISAVNQSVSQSLSARQPY